MRIKPCHAVARDDTCLLQQSVDGAMFYPLLERDRRQTSTVSDPVDDEWRRQRLVRCFQALLVGEVYQDEAVQVCLLRQGRLHWRFCNGPLSGSMIIACWQAQTLALELVVTSYTLKRRLQSLLPHLEQLLAARFGLFTIRLKVASYAGF
ncbi:hypothetical protein [Serratia quinivorans]|uniref:hypothetical protein n=1 Tax=Serratia quinivorans TaxID=137545 RepID=UPI002178296D|nr:hypothetical protein [Serratia quinivorans]CAI1008771.1 Uncharacterised protein [Serratia quinivorans]CAI1809316.1 Uncharacterised protein [Serratia quinivorans]